MHGLFFLGTFLILNITSIYSQITYFLIGGVTDTTFQMRAKSLDGASIGIFLNGNSKGSFSAGVDFLYNITINNLTPSTTYSLGIDYVGAHFSTNRTVTTFPSANTTSGNFTFIASSNMAYKSTAFVYDKIIARSPRFFMLLGNAHDKDIHSSNPVDYENIYANGKY